MPRSKAQQKKTADLYAKIIATTKANPHVIDREIGKMLGCSIATIERARRKVGMTKTPPYKGFSSKLNSEARQWILENWQNSNDHQIAAKFGVSITSVYVWRKKLGLFYSHKGKWTRYAHPKGFQNGKHTPEAKAAISRASIAEWANPHSKSNSDERAQKLGDAVSKSWRRRSKAEIYSRSLKGKREGLGDHYFRSRWEANIARYLNLLKTRGEITKWDFEPDTFWFEKIKRGVRSYTPDFKVWTTPESEPYYIEVKGWMDPKSKTKLSRMAKYYPHIKIELIAKTEYEAISKIFGHLIKDWEAK